MSAEVQASDFVPEGVTHSVREWVIKTFDIPRDVSDAASWGYHRTPTRWQTLVVTWVRHDYGTWHADAAVCGRRVLKSGELTDTRSYSLWSRNEPWLKDLIEKEAPQ